MAATAYQVRGRASPSIPTSTPSRRSPPSANRSGAASPEPTSSPPTRSARRWATDDHLSPAGRGETQSPPPCGEGEGWGNPHPPPRGGGGGGGGSMGRSAHGAAEPQASMKRAMLPSRARRPR